MPQKRGFALLDKDTLAARSSKGGKTAHAMGRAHEWTSATAREASLVAAANRNNKPLNEVQNTVVSPDSLK
jgi:hypothetical protein